MKLMFVATECAPFIKTGGLADVIGALPVYLKEKLVNEVRNHLGLGFYDISNMMIEFEVIGTVLNEYCRNKIVDELGIDGVIAPEVGYFVVFNPNSITDVKRA